MRATGEGLLFRWRGVLAYDGTDFQGWQRQPDGRPTIQGELEAALGTLAGHPVPTIGASRTDSGVHAWGQVIHAATSRWREPERWRVSLNGLLPKAIRVREWTEASWSFHARHQACGKTYTYDLAWGDEPPPMVRGLTPWWSRRLLDLDRCAEGLTALRSQTDWSSFTSEATPPPQALTGCWLATSPGRARLIVQGPGFAFQQVRRMACAVRDYAIGTRTAAQFQELLRTPRWNAQEQPAPPGGLLLVAVHFEPDTLGSLPADALLGWWSDPRQCEVRAL